MGDHTPGPWKVSVWANNTGYGGQPSGIYIEDECGEELEICTFDCPYDLGQEEAESNARLIARAPELLSENAALRAKVERLEGEKLRLREVVVMVDLENRRWHPQPLPSGISHQLAAVLRETEANTETGRK